MNTNEYIPKTVKVRRDSISDDLRKFILIRDHHTCRYCGSKTPPFHLDHVYPVSKGGETSADNLVTSCEDCNQKKLAKLGILPYPIEYFKEIETIKENEHTKFSIPFAVITMGTMTLFYAAFGTLVTGKPINADVLDAGLVVLTLGILMGSRRR